MGKTSHYHIWKKRNGNGSYTSYLFPPLHFLGCSDLEELPAIQHFMCTFQCLPASWSPVQYISAFPSNLLSDLLSAFSMPKMQFPRSGPLLFPILYFLQISTFSYQGQNQPFPISQSSHFDTGPFLNETSQLALFGEWILKLEKVQITTVCSDSCEFCEPNHRLNESSDFGKIITSYRAIFLVFSMQWIF